jgi:ribosomal protein L7Ae-like RNA K-turn-binding protein
MFIDKMIKLLHLARRARKMVFGFDACKRSVSAGHSHLVILASDLVNRSKQEMIAIAEANGVQWLQAGTKDAFGSAFQARDIGIISVEDANFAKGIRKIFTEDCEKYELQRGNRAN